MAMPLTPATGSEVPPGHKATRSDSVLLGLGLGGWQGWSPAGWIFVLPALAKLKEVLSHV